MPLLRPGSSGPPITAIQLRLKDLSFDPGPSVAAPSERRKDSGRRPPLQHLLSFYFANLNRREPCTQN